jgi:hypothetical protein
MISGNSGGIRRVSLCGNLRLVTASLKVEEECMSSHISRRFMLALFAALPTSFGTFFRAAARAQDADPLPSWNAGHAKQSILDFVTAVTRKGSQDFVPEPLRIATFDDDGTLWVEQPMYTQLAFALDRVKALAPQHPEWNTKQPFKAALEGDMVSLAGSGERGVVELIVASHADITTQEFESIVIDWLATARHPRFNRPYTDLVYQPMLELLAYLGANRFKTFIMSGGVVEFVRPWTEQVFGVPPEQIVGSRSKIRLAIRDGRPLLFRLPEANFVDDKSGKAVGFDEYVGRRPIAAFGNSDGDLEMLQWVTLAGDRRRFSLIVHHTDSEREYAYDRHSYFGRLDEALQAAAVNRWTVVNMKGDWRSIFPPVGRLQGVGSRAIK